MFIAAGGWAIIVVALTSWPENPGDATSPLGSLAAWHAHEMVFGFAAAGFAGYALTAMSSWSAPSCLTRSGVVMLIGAWVLARLSAWGSLGQDPRLVVPAGAAFMAFVTATLCVAALRSGSMRGGVPALFSALLMGVQGALLCGASMPQVPVVAFGLLLSVVGGRMVAAFTWNHMDRSPAQARRFVWARRSGLPSAGAIALLLVLDLAGMGEGWLAIGLLSLAALSEAMRLLLWRSRQTLRDSLLGMLHLGYVWLPVGLALVALSRLPARALSGSDALHALAAGAVACSIFAVAVRPLARRARRLHAALVDVMGFGLLWLGAAFRVFGPTGSDWGQVAPVLWCAAWALFLVRHVATSFAPVPRPVFSGPRI